MHAPALGARLVDGQVEVAVASAHAERVELCLAGADGYGPKAPKLALPHRDGDLWHGRFDAAEHGARPRATYALRAHGPWDPSTGRCFDPGRLLLDPYARAVTGAEAQPFGVLLGPEQERLDWQGDAPPGTPLDRSVVYEAHVRGLTRRHPDVPPHLRGTYAGLACPPVLDHLTRLGVTAVELLPVHQSRAEPSLRARGARNYWGYATLGFFAPHAAYSAHGDRGEQVTEFKAMVRDLHAAGLEVWLDVVYNHTCEGPQPAPALSWRGLDDAAYYRREHGRYADVTGCGNTMRTDHPTTLRLVLDSLRYWVEEMHVDGFRFDLASALARTEHRVHPYAPLMSAIGQDPVLQRVKLVAEPWDVTPEGYLLGGFPPGWSEWNGRFRDDVRDAWRGHGDDRGLAARLAGSPDLFAAAHRRPAASVNFVTSHDGFTLRDLVSYERKHNEANGEGNRDGDDHNHAWNSGVEGAAAADVAVDALRRRRAASMLTTVLLAAGVPMLTAGDERGRTQRGNNNAYCHDDDTSWLDWTDAGDWGDLTTLVARLTSLRREHAALRPAYFATGTPVGPGGAVDLAWFGADGHRRHTDELGRASRGMAMFRADADAAFLLVLRTDGADTTWQLPGPPWASGYVLELDTAAPRTWSPGRIDLVPAVRELPAGASLSMCAWSAVLLRCLR